MGAPEPWAQEAFAQEEHASEALLRAVRSIAAGPLAKAAEAIDRQGHYPEAILRQLGACGALGVHLGCAPHSAGTDGGGAATQGDFVTALQAAEAVSRVCGATGFMVWCHQVCGLYLQHSGNPHLQGEVLERHAQGLQLGGTGLSNPMKALSDIEPFLLKARAVEGGYEVDGTLPWVSNLGADHHFGTIAQVVGSDGLRLHEVMFLVRCDEPGVTLRNCPSFSAMEGTNTWAVALHRYRVDAHNLVADPAKSLVGRIKGAFILLQLGMGLGVAQGAIDSMERVEDVLGHVNQYLEDRPDELQRELDGLRARVMALAREPYRTDQAHLLNILDARIHASELALRAAQSALLHAGARGYLLSSDVQRRVRESHFVAIVTPAVKHLRREVDRLMRTPTPSAA